MSKHARLANLFGVLAILICAAASAELPACFDCTCFSSCSTVCYAANDPGPGTHHELCDMWLCVGHPDCENPGSDSDLASSENALFGSAPSAGQAQCREALSMFSEGPTEMALPVER